jgi:hypothetical protein
MASRAQPTPRALGLSTYDTQGITSFVRGSPAEVAPLLEDVRRLAEVLADRGTGDDARVRLISRVAAAARAQQRILESLLGDRLAQRDFEAVKAISRALDGAARRLATALSLLAEESSARRRPTVSIHHAEAVHFAEVGA